MNMSVPFEGYPAAETAGPHALGDGVELSVRTDVACILFTAAVDVHELLEEFTDILGLPVPSSAGTVARLADRTALWLSPRSWLVHVPADQEDDLLTAFAAAFPDRRLHATRFGDALCWLRLSGAGAASLLQQGGFISLEPGGLGIDSAKRTLVAGVPVIVHRAEGELWLLAVERSRARYFIEWLRAASVGGPPQEGEA